MDYRRQLKSAEVLLIAGLVLAGLDTGGIRAESVAQAEAASDALTITLEAGDYTLHEEGDGQTRIQMAEDFGSFGAPGEPELPARTFLIALPPGAQVTGVRFETPDSLTLSGRYRVVPVGPAAFDPGGAERATARWEASRARAYATDAPYPGPVGEYLGQGQWRRYTYARVAFQPFSYRPLSGALSFHPTLVVTVEYRLAESDSPAWREFEQLRDDHVLDDVISQHLINFDQARAWYDGSSVTPLAAANSLYDYVIVVQNNAMATTVNPFKTWKESLGHTVNVVTLDWIHASYSGVDTAEEVWNFLHDKYPSSEWGIRYVMLVGDLQVIPTRRVYYNDTEWGLRSDHFFAKLSGGDTGEQVWNSDGDVRWGELDDDEMTVEPDVLVGRIPLNSTTGVSTAVQAMITFEQDDGTWKHSALMAAGYATIHSATSKRDGAVLMEYVRQHLLDPNGWSYTRIYEQSGVGTSTYTGTIDYDTSPANVVTGWNSKDHGLAILFDHGSPGGLSGHVWQHDTLTVTGQVDPGEWGWSDLFRFQDVAALTNTHPSIVELLGCNTLMLVTPPWPIPDETMADPGGYTGNVGGEMLARGAAAGVVGFSSPGPASSSTWSNPDHGDVYSIAYYFTENLIQSHYTLGRSLYEAKIRYTNKFWNNNYQPFHWSFHLFGDPSMILEGYDDSAKGTNRTIHSGPVYAYGTDNADNGDMYVAVSTQDSDTDGEIKVYRSTNHGETWGLWTTVGHGEPIQAVDVLVGQWKLDEMSSDYVHVFFTDYAGHVIDARIDITTTARSDVTIANEGTGVNLPLISAARDPRPMPADFNLYVTWEVATGASHQVKVARSTLNGNIWTNQFSYDGYQQPHVDAGPWDRVYLVAVANAFPNDVHVKRSTDRGASWGSWSNLTSGDSGDYHGAPVVASSTDAAIPTVWVAYNYYKPVALGAIDLRYAYSKDSGGTWTKNQILSAEQGFDELMPDMVGYRTGASRWINVAYHHTQSARTNVVWRWASGSTPDNWWAPRPMNDHDTHPAMGPQVIYSPGAPATGSGVVYPGTGSPVTNLYFAAPWLTGTGSGAPSHRVALTGSTEKAPSRADGLPRPARPQAVAQTGLPGWAFTGEVGQAFRVAGLARSSSGTLYAAATTKEVDNANTGTVFRSDDDGATWEPVPALPLAWWLDSMLITDAGTLLVGGMMYDPGDPGAGARGVIYRSTNGGGDWSVVVERTDTAIVHSLLQRANGDVVAGAGPGGVTLLSSDDGETWQPLATPPNAERVYALLETSGGTLYAGGARTDGSGAVYRFTGGGSWENTGALDNAAGVYALLEDASQVLYAGAAYTDNTGRVFRSLNSGQSWEVSESVGESQAVRALLEGAAGKLYAGVDMGPGLFTSYVYVSEDGGDKWQDGGFLFMADAVHDLLLTPGGDVYVASGDTYGVVFRAWKQQIYLPCVFRASGGGASQRQRPGHGVWAGHPAGFS
jgi:photosystem II stability/assembly factor-like uncharacterized protein